MYLGFLLPQEYSKWESLYVPHGNQGSMNVADSLSEGVAPKS